MPYFNRPYFGHYETNHELELHIRIRESARDELLEIRRVKKEREQEESKKTQTKQSGS